MENFTDEKEKIWLAQLQNGEEAGLRSIFDQYYSFLLSEIHKILPDEDSCKDLAQEIFVELWRKRNELEIKVSLRAYLRRAAHNRTLNYIKSQKRYHFGIEDNEQAVMPEETTDGNPKENMETALHAAIETLPEKCKVVFNLSRFEQKSHKQIAEELGISVKTIENQITKALKILRETLIKYQNLSSICILLCKLLQTIGDWAQKIV